MTFLKTFNFNLVNLLIFYIIIEGNINEHLCAKHYSHIDNLTGLQNLKKQENHRVEKSINQEKDKNKIAKNHTRTYSDSEEMKFRKAATKPNEHVNVSFNTGEKASLHCRLARLPTENYTLVWLKYNGGNITILTASEKVITPDKRFLAINDRKGSLDWILHIRYVTQSDEGIYRCKVCNTSEIVHTFILKVVEAHAEIIGGPLRHVEKVGSPLRLSCVLRNSVHAPAYIFWYHEDRVINYDLGDGATVRQGRSGSELIFPRANLTHSGNYSCVPSNALQASVIVEFEGHDNPRKNIAAGSHSLDHVFNMLVLAVLVSSCNLRR